MEEKCKNQILDELFEHRTEDFVRLYKEKYGEPEEVRQTKECEEALTQLLQNTVSNKEELEEIFKQLNFFQSNLLGELHLWNKLYYKLGFIDGIDFRVEVKTEEKNLSLRQCEKGFFDTYVEEMTDYIETEKTKRLRQRNDYMEVMSKMERIKEQYPKIREYFEDDKISSFNEEETQTTLRLIRLYEELYRITEEEIFKIGFHEGKIL